MSDLIEFSISIEMKRIPSLIFLKFNIMLNNFKSLCNCFNIRDTNLFTEKNFSITNSKRNLCLIRAVFLTLKKATF